MSTEVEQQQPTVAPIDGELAAETAAPNNEQKTEEKNGAVKETQPPKDPLVDTTGWLKEQPKEGIHKVSYLNTIFREQIMSFRPPSIFLTGISTNSLPRMIPISLLCPSRDLSPNPSSSRRLRMVLFWPVSPTYLSPDPLRPSRKVKKPKLRRTKRPTLKASSLLLRNTSPRNKSSLSTT